MTALKSSWRIMLMALFLGIHLGGCNTVEGVGRDVEAAGDAIEDAAEDAND
ncbi:MAG TPA: entericidin A/B family lipoprotein [Gammaproteobacteria bacterium]